jgi:hypothetical protein
VPVAALLQPTDHDLQIGCDTATTALTLAPGVGHYTAPDGSRGRIDIAPILPAFPAGVSGHLSS